MMWLALVIVCLCYGVWAVLTPTTRFRFSRDRKQNVAAEILGSVVITAANLAAEPVVKAMDAMEWKKVRMMGILVLLFVMLMAIPLMLSWVIALIWLVPAGYLAWVITGRMIVKMYSTWQVKVMDGLPSLISILRVHLDMGRTVQDALSQALPGVSEPLRGEMSRTLTDMALSRARESDGDRPSEARQALVRLANRVNTMEFRMFTETLVQAWGSRLSGEALAPLTELMRISRERRSEEKSSKLDMVMTVAPGLAIFAIVVWAIGGFILSSLSGGAFSF